MALPAHRGSGVGTPNASDFLDLYAHERPGPARPVDEFLAELRDLIRAHPIDTSLPEILKYGGASREAMQRWIKDYYQWLRLDAHGSAATVARAPRRGLFLACSPIVSRKTGFNQVTTPALELFVRFAAAFDVTREQLEGHFACPETMQATFARLQFQFSSFDEGFVVGALASEGSLLDVARDERPFLCQRGIAEYMKRAWQLDDDAVAYWRAFEDFTGFVREPVWEIAREIAHDASQQQRLRTVLHHWLLLYQNMRQAWGEIAAGTYPLPDFVWPPPGRAFPAAAATHEEMEEELAEFCAALVRPKETAFGFLLSGRASLAAARELAMDFFQLDATRAIAGQFSRIVDHKALPAMAQAFATESGGYLTRCHMEIWADFCERAFGVTRADLQAWLPPTETIGSHYVTKWFLTHGLPEEAMAAFHLGPPPRARERMGKSAYGLGQGGVAGEGLLQAGATKSPLVGAFQRLGIDPDLAEYFFRLHREIEPFEQDEGWEYVPAFIVSPQQRRLFTRAYMEKILSERRKDEGLLRRMKALS